jgi:hypothetical protein
MTYTFIPAFLNRLTHIAALRESRTAIQRITNKLAQVKHFLNEFSENLFFYAISSQIPSGEPSTRTLFSERVSWRKCFVLCAFAGGGWAVEAGQAQAGWRGDAGAAGSDCSGAAATE